MVGAQCSREKQNKWAATKRGLFFTFSANDCWSWLTSRGVMRGMKPSSADGGFSSLSDRLLPSFTMAVWLPENAWTDLESRDRRFRSERLRL